MRPRSLPLTAARLVALALTLSLPGLAAAAPPDPPSSDGAQRAAQDRRHRARPHRTRGHHGRGHRGHEAPPPPEGDDLREPVPRDGVRPVPAPRDPRDPLIPLPF